MWLECWSDFADSLQDHILFPWHGRNLKVGPGPESFGLFWTLRTFTHKPGARPAGPRNCRLPVILPAVIPHTTPCIDEIIAHVIFVSLPLHINSWKEGASPSGTKIWRPRNDAKRSQQEFCDGIGWQCRIDWFRCIEFDWGSLISSQYQHGRSGSATAVRAGAHMLARAEAGKAGHGGIADALLMRGVNASIGRAIPWASRGANRPVRYPDPKSIIDPGTPILGSLARDSPQKRQKN